MDGDRVLETSSAQHYSAQSPSERGEAVRVVDVTLHLPGLQRDDNGRDIKCVASNTNLTQEKVRVVTIDMYRKCASVSLSVFIKSITVPALSRSRRASLSSPFASFQ